MGLKFTRGKQTGIKKTDYILSLPEVSFCSKKNRKKRCRREPKCQHVDCLRNALERCINETVGGKTYFRALKSQNGYDAGFIKDEFNCNSNKCECAHFDQIVIGKLDFFIPETGIQSMSQKSI